MSHFYLTLPSHGCQEIFPDNTVATYKTKLLDEIDLVGDWEVALCDIIYPRSFFNVSKTQYMSVFRNDIMELEHETVETYVKTNARATEPGVLKWVNVEAGYYASMHDLIGEIQRLMLSDDQPAGRSLYAMADLSLKQRRKLLENGWPILDFRETNERLYVTVPARTTVNMSSDLRLIMGMEKAQLPLRNVTEGEIQFLSNRMTDIMGGVYSMYVHCDIVEKTPVGNQLVSLLRIVDIQGKHGDVIHRNFEKPRYVPVLKRHFDSLEIHIRNGFGEVIPFERGTSIVTLHFRQVRERYML